MRASVAYYAQCTTHRVTDWFPLWVYRSPMSLWWEAYDAAANGCSWNDFLAILAQGALVPGPGPMQHQAAHHVAAFELQTDRSGVCADALWGLAHFRFGAIPWRINEVLLDHGYRKLLRPNEIATRLGQLREDACVYARTTAGQEYYGKIYRPTHYLHRYTPLKRPSAMHWVSDVGWFKLAQLIANGIYPQPGKIIYRRKMM